jgi:hypothetical protein
VLRSKYFWGTLAIIAMWVAVLIIGVTTVEGFVVDTAAGDVRIPAVWGVALFALIGTAVTAGAAFRDAPEPKQEEKPPTPEA